MASLYETFSAGEALKAQRRLRARTRATRHGRWFPLALFGGVTLGAAPFLVQTGVFKGGVTTAPTDNFLGVPGGPSGLTFYWLVAVPAAFLLTVAYYRRQAAQTGVDGRVWPFLIGGIAIFVLLALSSNGTLEWLGLASDRHPSPILLPADLDLRGALPLLAISGGVLVLAKLERSRMLCAFGVAFLGLSLLANLYDMDNLLPRIGFPDGGYEFNQLPNVVIPALALLGAATFFAIGDRRVLARAETLNA